MIFTEFVFLLNNRVNFSLRSQPIKLPSLCRSSWTQGGQKTNRKESHTRNTIGNSSTVLPTVSRFVGRVCTFIGYPLFPFYRDGSFLIKEVLRGHVRRRRYRVGTDLVNTVLPEGINRKGLGTYLLHLGLVLDPSRSFLSLLLTTTMR